MPALPTITPSPKLEAGQELKARDFTVPQYLEDWYFYGRIDPACSCIITSAAPSILIEETDTVTSWIHTVVSLSELCVLVSHADSILEYDYYGDIYHL